MFLRTDRWHFNVGKIFAVSSLLHANHGRRRCLSRRNPFREGELGEPRGGTRLISPRCYRRDKVILTMIQLARIMGGGTASPCCLFRRQLVARRVFLAFLVFEIEHVDSTTFRYAGSNATISETERAIRRAV